MATRRQVELAIRSRRWLPQLQHKGSFLIRKFFYRFFTYTR